jgi:hypothetical protein
MTWRVTYTRIMTMPAEMSAWMAFWKALRRGDLPLPAELRQDGGTSVSD